MANETGIYKLKDGGWGFRYTISVCGKRKDVKRVRDAYGNPMKTKRDAVLARAEAMKAEEIPQQIRIVIYNFVGVRYPVNRRDNAPRFLLE